MSFENSPISKKVQEKVANALKKLIRNPLTSECSNKSQRVTWLEMAIKDKRIIIRIFLVKSIKKRHSNFVSKLRNSCGLLLRNQLHDQILLVPHYI